MIKLDNITKRYGKNQVLKDISLEIASGETIAIIGRNGCGKSTLLQIMAGCLKPDSGTLSYYGKEATGHSKVFQSYCGYLPQENPLMEQLSVRDNLKLWNTSSSQISGKLLEDFGLTDILTKPVIQLSGGMKRRLALACAYINNPPVLLLDEPTTALDFYHKEVIQRTLAEHRQKKGIVVLITHDMDEITGSDRCLLVENGVIRELNKTDISKTFLAALYKEN